MESSDRSKFIIVGAGLVGCLAAQYMSKLGFRVIVYEYRDDIRKQNKIEGQSINLALSTRGLHALENAGINITTILDVAVPVKGRMIHERGDTRSSLYDVKYQRCIYSVGRNELNKLLISEVEKQATINFGHKVINVDLKKKLVKIQRINDGVEIEFGFDRLIGCDGAHSIVRQAFLKTPLFNYNQTYIDHGYMELRIPSKKSNKTSLSSSFLHIWPRSTFMMIALPNHDESWTVTLFMPFVVFDSLKSAEEVIDFFRANFSDALPLIGYDNLIQTFFHSKYQPLISVKCNRYNFQNHSLIVGDAAHAVVPFFGQGMNAGFEDCYILYRTLTKYGCERGFEEFSKIRTIDGNAVSDLSMYNYLEMRNLVKNKLFRLGKWVDNFLYSIAPNFWKPLYICVTFTSIPYSQCLTTSHIHKYVLFVSFILFNILICSAIVFTSMFYFG